MKLSCAIGTGVALAFGLSLGFGEAVDAREVDYELQWTMGSVEVPAESFWVKEQGQLAETRLWPTALFSIDREVSASDGKLLLPQGAQIVKLSADRLIACNIIKGSDRKYRSARKRICLVDDNGNGAFDSYFETGSGGYWWFALAGKLKANRKAIAPVTVTKISPQEMKGAPYISFHYQRFLDKGNFYQKVLDAGSGDFVPRQGDMIRFHFKVGREKRREWMVGGCGTLRDPYLCASGTLPSDYEILGMRLKVLERKKESLRFKMTSGFNPHRIRLVHEGGAYTSGAIQKVAEE